MARETVAEKADRYLLEGRLILRRVSGDQITGFVRGDGAIHRFGWTTRTGWACSCPARTSRCAHLLAAGKVVAVGDPVKPPERR